jgi:geranylgeranyl reductase family protein
MESFDVLVVGAGPAGACAAHGCAEAGLSTLVLEKETLPRDKPCGGMIDISADETYPEIAPVVERRTLLSRTFLNYEEIEEHMNQNIMILRTTFDEFLARRAQKAGADLREGMNVKGIDVDADGVTVSCADGEDFRGKLLIDGSGAKGIFFADHKRAVQRTIKYKIVSMVLEAPCPNEVMEERLRFDNEHGITYFNSYIMTGFVGYGWLFPKDGQMNAGLGTITTRSAGLKPMFKDFLERSGFGDLDFAKATAGLIPVKVLPQLWLPRVMFVGDAGGFVDPLTGGGILLGMASGEKAAATAKEAVDAGDFSGRTLSAYERRSADIRKELAFKTRALKWVTAGVGMGLDNPRVVRFVLKKLQRKFDSSEWKNR